MSCPHLEYRQEGDGRTFDEPRAYCTVTDGFVQPMRADVCNDRYDLDHAEHCEIYRDAESGVGE
ncbi:hypothetical protein [Haloarchaeobius litoreus]|uniref:Uncharacterized protein n=1 Tax=Haloarchaeobius litoreus TaxID=755306 RepID=A0ABD6DHU5_9EURY|nr:hypothetical protein [Haloarchaeobius litoreus]